MLFSTQVEVGVELKLELSLAKVKLLLWTNENQMTTYLHKIMKWISFIDLQTVFFVSVITDKMNIKRNVLITLVHARFALVTIATYPEVAFIKTVT